MKLELGAHGEREVSNEAELRKALSLLDGKGDSFAIMSIDEQNFIQTSGGGDEGFVVERRLGGTEKLDHALRAENAAAASASESHGKFDFEETVQLFLTVLLRRPNPFFVKWDARGVSVGSSGCTGVLAFLIAAPIMILLSSNVAS